MVRYFVLNFEFESQPAHIIYLFLQYFLLVGQTGLLVNGPNGSSWHDTTRYTSHVVHLCSPKINWVGLFHARAWLC